MRRLFCFCALLLWVATAVAQHADEVAAHYDKQYRELYKDYLADTTDVKAMLALSTFYSDEKNPMHSFALAVKYANKAESTYYTMVDRNDNPRAVRRLIKYGITIETAQARRQAALLQAGHYVVMSRSISEEELDAMLRDCGNSPAMRRLIEKKRVILHCDEAQKENTMAGYKAFIEKYPNTAEAYDCQVVMGKLAVSLFARAASGREVDSLMAPYKDIVTVQHAARERKSELAFDTVRQYGSPAQLQNFLSQYPYTGCYLEALDEIDVVRSQQLTAIDDPDSLLLFIRQNETTPLSDKALAKLRSKIIVDNDARAAQLYFDNFPNDMEYMGLFQVYYKRYAIEGNRNVLDNFAQRFPQFPYPKLLHRDRMLCASADSLDLLQPFVESDYANYLTYVYNMAGKDIAFVAVQRTLQPYIERKNWNAMVQRMADFQPTFELHGSDLVQRLYDLVDAPTDTRKVVAAESVPAYDMLHPCMTADGAHLYYTRRSEGKSSVHVAGRAHSKKYKWASLGDVTVVGSNEGDYLFYGLYDNDSRMLLGYKGDIWTAAKVSATVWRLEERLPAPVNTDYNDFDPFMLADGSGILIASDRPYGQNLQTSGTYFHGDTAMASDLYYIPRTGTGWGPAVNLGVAVNSIYCERSPLLSNDLKTLYFVTDGQAGMGYGDICFATRKDVNDWTSWQAAENYGKEVNSGKDEEGLSFTPDGAQLLFASNRGKYYGCYTVAAVEGMATAPAMTAIVGTGACRLKVVEPHNHLLLAETTAADDTAHCLLYDTKQYLVIPQDITDYSLFVPSATVCGGRPVQLQGYVPIAVIQPVASPAVSDSVAGSDSVLLPREAKELPLPAITFEADGLTLTPEAEEELRNVAAFLRRNRTVRASFALRVAGQDDAVCYEMGRRRCAIVHRWLTQQGVKSDRVEVSNYGRLTAQNGSVELLLTLHTKSRR